MGYNFNWIGNASHNCELYNPNYCMESSGDLSINNLISPYVTNTFLERSPITPIYHRINNFLKTEIKQEDNYEFKKNDAINNFLKKIKNVDKSKNNFFLIHHNMPHTPYIFESDCSKNDNKNENLLIGYRKIYECMLSRLLTFSEYINKYDPQANVIITADHGNFLFNRTSDNQVEVIVDRYDTFTMIKINKECKKNINSKLNIPNEIRLLLACSNNLEIELLEPKNYYVTYEGGSFTFGAKHKLHEFKSKTHENFKAEVVLVARDMLSKLVEEVEKSIIKSTDSN